MFSYIVTGVIFVYNSFVILLCVFSVYGAYAIFREIALACARKKQIVAAVRVTADQAETIAVAEYYTQKYPYLESRPVLLCDTDPPTDVEQYGLDVYIKLPERRSRGD